MDAGLAGLQQALGQAGLVLGESGPPVVASEALPPAQTVAVEADPSVSPPAAPQPVTAPDGPVEHMSLDEYEAALTGQVAPETGVETAETPTEAAPEQTFTERELEMQRQLDEYKAKEAEDEVWDKIGEWEDKYAEKEAEGKVYWENTVPARIEAAAKQQAAQYGWSDAEMEARKNAALAYAKDAQRKWDLQLQAEKLTNPRLTPEYYKQPALVDQLVTQYGLSAEDKTVLQKYAANPELMKDFAQTLGARVQAHQTQLTQTNAQRQGQLQARQEVAAHLQNGITPAAPNVAPHKAPPNFREIPNEEGAAFFARLVQSGAMKARP
jgi:hypothetical protein